MTISWKATIMAFLHNTREMVNYKQIDMLSNGFPKALMLAMFEKIYLKEKKRVGEMAIAEELQRKQMEIETILNKKREEEHLKRLEFEEERIKVILHFLSELKNTNTSL